MFDRIFGEVKGIFNIETIANALISIIMILMGLSYFSSAENTTSGILLGLVVICYGGLEFYSYLKRESLVLFDFNHIFGVLFVIYGIVLMFLGKQISVGTSIFLILVGIQRVSYSLTLKKYNESSWLITLFTGLFFIAISVIGFMVNTDTLVKESGIMLFGYAAINLANILLLRKRSKYFIA